jgi:hypothetical protein
MPQPAAAGMMAAVGAGHAAPAATIRDSCQTRGETVDQHRFDIVPRSVRGVLPRRDVLRGLLGAGGGLAALRLSDAGAAKRKKRRKKRKQAQRCDVCRRGCRFASLQKAVDAAASGATIRLCPGSYPAPVTVAKNLTLRGAGVDRSILDGGGTDRATAVLTVASGATVVVRALTIRGGNGNENGGGIANEGALTLDGVRVTGNVAKQGGGIAHLAGELTLVDSRLSGNEATGSAGQGGGLIVFGGTVTLNRSDVTANEAPGVGGQGGGLYVLNDAEVRLNVSHVSENKATHGGGGLFISNGEVTLNDSQVTENEASPANASSEGGGIKIIGGTVTLSGSQVTGNTAANGGGIYNSAGDTAVTVEPGSVTGNTPNNCAGQAVGNCVN